MLRTVFRVTLGTAIFALTHSLLASETAKKGAESAFGPRFRNGLYRFLYNNITFISVGLLFWSFSKLPDKVLIRVPKPLSWLMRAGQLFGLWLILDANRRLGIGRFTGMAGAVEFVTGKEPVQEPPAQGPLLDGSKLGALEGSFRLSRHPNNLGPTLIALLNPTITVRSLTFALVGGAYAFFGSRLEERRAKRAFGEAYREYEATTPYFFPVGSRRRDVTPRA
jgi:hypothetical protein